MKRFMLLSVGVLCFSLAVALFMTSTAFAILPPIGYIGIFKDAAHQITLNHDGQYTGDNICPAQYAQFHAWIWCLPSVNGLEAAEFAVSFPATTVTLFATKNPLITVELGSLAGGMSVAFGEGSCQMDWAYLYDLTMIQLAPLVTQISIIPPPGPPPSPSLFTTCKADYPSEYCIYLTPLYLCHPVGCLCPIGVQQTNWGGIKSLF